MKFQGQFIYPKTTDDFLACDCVFFLSSAFHLSLLASLISILYHVTSGRDLMVLVIMGACASRVLDNGSFSRDVIRFQNPKLKSHESFYLHEA